APGPGGGGRGGRRAGAPGAVRRHGRGAPTGRGGGCGRPGGAARRVRHGDRHGPGRGGPGLAGRPGAGGRGGSGRPTRDPHRGHGLPAGGAAKHRPVTSGGDMVSRRRSGNAVSGRSSGDAPGVLALAREIAESVPDPELPMLTLADLGILRDVSANGDRVIVSLTPTYSGCPALAERRRDLTPRLGAAGLDAEVRTVLSPAWSSDWITAAGRRKLAAAGIAPPLPAPPRGGPFPLA